MDINLTPIGYVRNSIIEPHREDGQSVISEIVINEDLKEALSRLDEFSHIIIIYWMHQIPEGERSTMKIHPRRDPKLPLVGVFATRSPARPNPLGLATVKLLERHNNILKVTGLDAIDGSPILDIKPHIPGSDSPTGAKIPDWITK